MAGRIMKIGTMLDVSNETFLISGTYLGNPEDKVDINSFKGKKITIKDENGKIIKEVVVLDAKKNSSIVDLINIHFLLPMNVKSYLREGLIVYLS